MSESGRGEGTIAHRLANPAVHIRGSTSAEPVPGSPCLFFSPVFFFFFPRCSCFHNPSSPGPSAQRSSSSPTHSFFLYVFSKYSPPPLPPHSYKTLNSQQFLSFPQKVPWDFFSLSAEHWPEKTCETVFNRGIWLICSFTLIIMCWQFILSGEKIHEKCKSPSALTCSTFLAFATHRG